MLGAAGPSEARDVAAAPADDPTGGAEHGGADREDAGPDQEGASAVVAPRHRPEDVGLVRCFRKDI